MTLLLPKNRKYLYISLIVIFLFFGYLKIRANNTENSEIDKQQVIIDSYDDAKDIYNKAKEDIALGRGNNTDQLLQAMALANKSKEHDATRDKAIALIKEIQASIDKTTNTQHYYDLAPIFTLGEDVDKMVLAGNEIFGVDPNGKIFAADTRDKDPHLVASIGQENGSVVDLSYSKSTNKAYIYTTLNKVLIYDPVSKTYNEARITEGSEWSPSTAIASFVSNLYLLDINQGEIWKHLERDGGYSKGDDYVDTRQVSLKNALDFTIDGDIYVLNKDATAFKFVRGTYDASFGLRGVPTPNEKIDEPTQIFSDADSTHIFVLDRKLNRIIRFTKAGDFVNQYAFADFTPSAFTVNTKVQKLWVLGNGKIYEIDL